MFTVKATRRFGKGRDQLTNTEIFETASFEDRLGGYDELRAFFFYGTTHVRAVDTDHENPNVSPSLVMYLKDLTNGKHGDEAGQAEFYDEIIVENANGKTTHIARGFHPT